MWTLVVLSLLLGVDGCPDNTCANSWQLREYINLCTPFDNCSEYNISEWDVSHVTDMYMLFFMFTDFNDDISQWDVGAVVNMGVMFAGATHFNQNISQSTCHNSPQQVISELIYFDT